MNIYVGNLPYDAGETQLTELFSQYGQVQAASVIMDRATGRSRGFGFVEMPNSDEAKQAIDALNEKEFNGRALKINEAKPREERPRRSFGGDGGGRGPSQGRFGNGNGGNR
jgi:RNA recognition motif-containing protein